MSSLPTTTAVALFDLDGTLTFHDTLMPFLGGYLLRHPLRMLRLWQLAPALAEYARGRDRGRLKSRVIRAVMGGEPRAVIDAWARTYVEGLRPKRKFRAAALAALEAHRAAGDHLVLLSASPDLYVPYVGNSLRFELTLCTEVLWLGDRLDGGLKTENRRGEGKTALPRAASDPLSARPDHGLRKQRIRSRAHDPRRPCGAGQRQ